MLEHITGEDVKMTAREWKELSKEELFEILAAYKDKPLSMYVAISNKLREKNFDWTETIRERFEKDCV